MSYKYQMFIDGEWIGIEGRDNIPVLNPATGEELGYIPCATAEDLDRAAKAAGRAFVDWSATPPIERQRYLSRAADLIRERNEYIAHLLTLDQGKPLEEARSEVNAVADFLQWYGEEGRRVYGRTIPSTDRFTHQTVYLEPLGPVVVFGPWNFPVSEIGGHMAAALASGCTCILKAANETPGAPQEIIRAFADAGIPDGVVNCVVGRSSEIADYLIEHPAVRKISFTGSTPVGKMLAQKAVGLMKHSTMELGGNAPVIVTDTADVVTAAAQVAARKFRNAGQVCVAPNRIYVHKSQHDNFAAEFLSHVKNIRVGNGLDASTTMGPLVNVRRHGAIAQMVDETVSAGAELIAGGNKVGDVGCYWEPTVLTQVPENCPAFAEEIFGPIASITTFDDPEDVLTRANNVSVGLAAYIFSQNRSEIEHYRKGLQFGCIGINTLIISGTETPFGGMKDSGYGRVGGQEGLEVFLETKFVAERIHS